MVTRYVVASAWLASVVGGVWLGWSLRGEPPRKPNATEATRSSSASSFAQTNQTLGQAWSYEKQVIPASRTKTRRTEYYPPVAGCPVAEQCVCPGPGPIKSQEESDTHVDAGTGEKRSGSTVANNTNTTGRNSLDHEALNKYDQGDELPRFTLGIGAAASPLADERKLAPSVNLGTRFYKHYTLRVAGDVPIKAPREARVTLWLEFPL